jgi:hypothetical protein
MYKQLLLWIILLLLSACQTLPSQNPFIAPPHAIIIKTQFKHLTIYQQGNSARLHVYIEGDGIPFMNRFQVAKDPTPNSPLMPKLMAMDTNQSFYLGRPCYFTHTLLAMADKKCSPKMWTSARYSEDVVTSMVDALRQHLATHPAEGITLIGHSGGGTLAILMAARMSEVDQVVTLAGNLDTTAWTQLHHYSPLKESLNPAVLPVNSLPRKQLHFAGNKDENIPPTLILPLLQRLGLQINVVDNADHNCCWVAQWSSLLTQINQQMDH